MNFVITNHARERFVERFSRESIQFRHLSRCKYTDCEECRELNFFLLELVNTHRERWDTIIQAKLRDADDVRLFQNCGPFMEYMYEHYGYHRYKFLVESHILFVVKENEKNIVMTCVNANNPINGSMVIADFINRQRYNNNRQRYKVS